MKRPLVWAFGASVLGEILAGMPLWRVCLALPFLLAAAGRFRKSGYGRRLLLVSAFFFLGFFRSCLSPDREELSERILARAEAEKEEGENGSLTFPGRVCRLGLSGESAFLDLEAPGGRETIRFYVSEEIRERAEELLPGDEVLVRGKVKAVPEAKNPGEFDRKAYYGALRIILTGSAERLSLQRRPPFSLDAWLYRFKRLLLKGLKKAAESAGLSSEETAFTQALLLGERGELPEDEEQALGDLGLSHLLSISGLHVSFLGQGIYRLLTEFLPLSPGPAGLLSGLFTLLYARMTGGSRASFRAVIMFLLSLLRRRSGRSYDGPTACAAAGLLILLEEPLWLYQSGFQLSLAGVFGAAAAAPVVREWWRETSGGRLSPLAESWIFCLCLQTATLPVLLWHRYEYALPSIAGNLLALPLLPLLLAGGGSAALLGLLFPPAGGACLWPQRIFLLLGKGAAKAVFPIRRLITGRPYPWQILFALFITVLLLLRLHRREERRVFGGGNPGRSRFALPGFLPGLIRGASLLLYFAAMLALLWRPEEEGVKISFLSVGQGEAIVIQTGESAFLLDAGSSSDLRAGERIILPFLKEQGIGRLDAVILTHLDADHCNGLPAIIQDAFPADRLLLTPKHEKEETVYQLLKDAAAQGWQGRQVKAGDSYRDEKLSLFCLYPGEETEVREENETSAVFLLETGKLSVLLTGDLPGSREEELANAISRKLREPEDRLVVLKAAHHGSRSSTGEAFLRLLSPEWTVISCGEKNRYGHPHEETLERLRNAGSQVLVTAEAGCISIRVLDGVFSVLAGYEEECLYHEDIE